MSIPPFSCCDAREPHVTRTGHADGDAIVAPGPRAYNPAPLMSVVCVPDLVWSKNSCGFARIVFQEPPEPFTALNRAFALWVLADHRKEQHVALALMISLVM